MKYGYVRVSSKDQDENRQIMALKKVGVSEENIFLDKDSGKNFERVSWNLLMAKLVIGDIIVIKELDRMGRNNNELKENFELIKNKGCYLEFVENPLLSTKNKSEIELELIQPLILHLLVYFAEKERKKILQRQKEAYKSLERDEKGRMISRKKRKPVGRPSKIENISSEQKRYILAWINKNIKLSDCINITGFSEATLYRIKRLWQI